jgi:hypothetical protein
MSGRRRSTTRSPSCTSNRRSASGNGFRIAERRKARVRLHERLLAHGLGERRQKHAIEHPERRELGALLRPELDLAARTQHGPDHHLAAAAVGDRVETGGDPTDPSRERALSRRAALPQIDLHPDRVLPRSYPGSPR